MLMAFIVGIDEAGYGPLLGPLVCAAASFGTAGNDTADDLWKALQTGVVRNGSPRSRKVWIGDSKSLYQSSAGLELLEKMVLATCPLPLPCSFADFAAWLEIPDEHLQAGEPWHAEPMPTLPLVADADEIDALRRQFARATASCGVSLLGVRVNLAQPWRYNQLVGLSDNKAAALWSLHSHLLESACRRYRGQPLHVTLDKQGGRTYYQECLQQLFPMQMVQKLCELPQRSHYRLHIADLQLDLQVLEKSETFSLPAALASMYAKYVREVFMHRFNDWWCSRVDGLTATAGYPGDVRRWFNQMEPHLAALPLDRNVYIRCR